MTQPSAKANILLVDDTPANLLAMEVTLESLGETMVRAYSGREALQQFEQQEFAVVLMDVQMPVMDGFEAAVRIREVEAKKTGSRRTPIIFVTAAELTDDHMRRAYAEGAVDFMRKPYVAEILRSKVKVFVDLYHNAAQLQASEEEVRRLNEDLERRVAARTVELNEALQQAEANEQRYRTLAEAMPQIVWTATPAGEIDYMNSRWTEFTGVPLEKGTDRKWLACIHEEDVNEVEQRWQHSINTRQGFEAQGRLCSQDRNYFWFLARAEPLLAPDGTVQRWLGTFTDIDTQKRAEAVLQEANLTLGEARDRALEASKAKSLFLANMSHELRTPLNAIMGYAEIIEDELPPDAGPEVRDDIRRIVLAGQHLLALINDVLDLAKIEAGKMEITLQEFALEPVVQQVASAVIPIAQRRDNTMKVQCLPECGNMYADELKVRQILLNLLGNACKFTENGEINLSTRTEDDADGKRWVLLEVRDTGIGIAAEQLPKLFQEFSQADPTPTRSYGGTGLGLALSRRFVEMMGGTIHVESEEHQGSTFTVRLPSHVSES